MRAACPLCQPTKLSRTCFFPESGCFLLTQDVIFFLGSNSSVRPQRARTLAVDRTVWQNGGRNGDRPSSHKPFLLLEHRLIVVLQAEIICYGSIRGARGKQANLRLRHDKRERVLKVRRHAGQATQKRENEQGQRLTFASFLVYFSGYYLF
jgi:hypothetical protein